MPTPPRAPRQPQDLTAQGDRRVDDWYWIRGRDARAVSYLEAENDYTRQVLAPLEALRGRLYTEMRARIQETDVSAPARKGPWWYYSRTVEGLQYAIHCRRPDPGRRLVAGEVMAAAAEGQPGEEVLLDENEAAAGSEYFALGVFDVSPDQSWLAYAVDRSGGERYTLRFRDLARSVDLVEEIGPVYYTSAWSADSRSLFYTRTDDVVRPWQIWRHRLGGRPEEDRLVFQENDERFFVSVHLTRSERFVVVSSESKMTSEASVLDASDPDWTIRVVEPRLQGVEYQVEHARRPDGADVWLILTNADGADNFALMEAPVSDPGRASWRELLPHRPNVRLDRVDAFADHLVVSERERALERLRVISWADGAHRVIEQPEPVYSLAGSVNAEFDSPVVRFGYTSLVTPASTVEFEVASGRRAVVKEQPVLGGYDPTAFTTGRLWARAADGVEVPISIVHPSDLRRDGSAPCLLYGYGAYEVTIDPTFSSLRLNLLERGFSFAIAHVRGGGELGRRWYEDGRLLRKRNTFTDFIACAEHLVRLGYTTPDRLVIRGGSAGGLLMGAVTNMRPELWRAVVAEVPFVDCLTTMLDDSLPLTVTEWEEWGNPVEDRGAYEYIKSYSPYDNVAPTAFPRLYVTAGLNDPRVGFWEPAKWVAKIRALRTDDAPLVLKTEMDAGHRGPSGRYDAWKDEAQVQAFVLAAVEAAGPLLS
jgi:oligopeptidase B